MPTMLIVLALVGCSGGDGTRYSGRLLDAQQFEQQWGLHVLLDDDRTIIGSDDISISVPVDQLGCSDGAPIGARTPAVDGVVRFTRRGNDADGSSPPGVGSRDVVVDCTANG